MCPDHKQSVTAGCVGTKGCGLLVTMRLPTPLQEATLSFRVRFGEGYEWTHGGKLPGVYSHRS